MLVSSTISLKQLENALDGGDIATVILYETAAAQNDFQAYCSEIVPLVQNHDVAAIVADDTQAFGRSSADGLYVQKEKGKLGDLVARFSPQNIVGCNAGKNRHSALEAGECKPDFILFGVPGGDIRPQAHPKNIALAEWWSELVEIPSIILGGNDPESVVECAATRADFVALDAAVFSSARSPGEVVAEVNELLNRHAPILGDDA